MRLLHASKWKMETFFSTMQWYGCSLRVARDGYRLRKFSYNLVTRVCFYCVLHLHTCIWCCLHIFFIVVYAFCTVIQFSWVRPMRRTSFYELFVFDEIVNMNHNTTNKPSSPTEQSFGTRITTLVFYLKKRNSLVLYIKKFLILFFMENQWVCFRSLFFSIFL